MRISKRLVLVSALLSGCTSEAMDLPNSYEEADEPSRKMFRDKRDTPEFREYVSALTEFWNKPEEKNKREDCSSLFQRGEGSVSQIMIIDDEGKVVRVFHNVANAVADCGVRNHLGKVYPEPPFSPFYTRGSILNLFR